VILLPVLLAILAQQPPAPVQESIVVERIVIDARVLTGVGEPVTGLGVADFKVRIDGKPAVVESVDWIPETAVARQVADIDHPAVEVNPEINRTVDIQAPRGRLMVYFFQTDICREPSRLGGQMQMDQQIDHMLQYLEPEDRVAVLSFDSHLKLRSDFTNDKHRLRTAMEEALLTNEPSPPPPPAPAPSIAKHLDSEEMRKAAKTETALTLIANALRPIPGPKSLIFIGYGMGRWSMDGSRMEFDYPATVAALEAARVSVFTLDVTTADKHSLSVGLVKVAEDTGGLYLSTFHFPILAIDRAQHALGGHYEIEVRKPDTKVQGTHRIGVTVNRRNAEVLARTTYVDKE
jgi:VWFA-related protein